MADQEIRALEAELRLDPQNHSLRLLLLRRYLQSNMTTLRIVEDLALLNDSAARVLISQMGPLVRVPDPDRVFNAVEYLFAIKSEDLVIAQDDYFKNAAGVVAAFGQLSNEGCNQTLAWLYLEAIRTMDSFEERLLGVFDNTELREYVNQRFPIPTDMDPHPTDSSEVMRRLELVGENLSVIQNWFENRVIIYMETSNSQAPWGSLSERNRFLKDRDEKFRVMLYLNSKLRAYVRLYWELQTLNTFDYHRREGLTDFVRGLETYLTPLMKRQTDLKQGVRGKLLKRGRRQLIKYLLPNYTPE